VAELPTRAQTVIVGAGIVGASAAYHLADLGETDVLVIDQGPLFATGGSTSHAPGLVFQTNPSRTMCRIAQDSVSLYSALDVDGQPVWYGVGGLELATTPERIAELQRRQGFARSWGLDDTELLSPAECAERSPLLDPAAILGGYWVPSDGAAKGVRVVEALATRARAAGIRFAGGVAVTGSSASACCSAQVSGARPSARSRASRSRSSRSSTSWCGPIPFLNWRRCRATHGRSTRSCAIRTCRCTCGSATTTTASATTATNRS
jgi:glycine/D-amino acid oxidase-like deaminating enzyme